MSSITLTSFEEINNDTINASDRLSMALFFAAALHAIIVLGVAFDDEEQVTSTPPPSLEIIVVQNQQNTQPDKADYLAEASQNGGGTSEDRDRPSDPFTAIIPSEQNGIAPELMEAGAPKIIDDNDTIVLTRIYSEEKVQQQEDVPEPAEPQQNKDKMAELDMQIAQMTAELNNARKAYAKRPKKLQLTASTQAYVAAGYMARWVEKIERIGNLNLPDAAQRNKLSGSLLLEVELKHDGSLVEVNVIQSSGHQVLDDAAKRTVYLSTPFESFPPKLRAEADHLEVVRTWEFSRTGLSTHY